jgi:hypothetical protein
VFELIAGGNVSIFRTKSVEQTLAETSESGRTLKRTLNAWDMAVMGVAVAVGAGIFSVGAQAAAFHAGPAVILSFIIAGVVCGAARNVLCRICFNVASSRICLYLYLHHSRRNYCVDYWLGFDFGDVDGQFGHLKVLGCISQ